MRGGVRGGGGWVGKWVCGCVAVRVGMFAWMNGCGEKDKEHRGVWKGKAVWGHQASHNPKRIAGNCSTTRSTLHGLQCSQAPTRSTAQRCWQNTLPSPNPNPKPRIRNRPTNPATHLYTEMTLLIPFNPLKKCRSLLFRGRATGEWGVGKAGGWEAPRELRAAKASGRARARARGRAGR